MNVLEVVSARDVRGPAVHVRDLSLELARRGHGVTVACRPGSWVEAEARALGIPLLPSDLHRLPPDELRRVAALAAHRRVDVVHTHMSRAHLFGVLLRLGWGVPCVATAHSRNLQPHWILNDRVIAVSEAVARYQRRVNLVRPSRIDVVPPFVDTVRCAPLPPQERAASRAALGAGEGPLLAVAGPVHEDKGLHVLVDALPPLLARWPALRVAVAGAGEAAYGARLREAAARNGAAGALLWLGPRTDLPRLLAACDVVAVPSLDETLSLVALEAGAAGVPVVASAVGGLPEAVEDGVTGLLVPAADPSRLARALAELLGDGALRERLGSVGRSRVEARFSPAAVVPRVEAVLGRAASRRARGRPWWSG